MDSSDYPPFRFARARRTPWAQDATGGLRDRHAGGGSMINEATKVSKELGPVHMAVSVTPSDIALVLEKRLAEATAVVTVIGVGYVGLPLVLAMVARGYRVHALDATADRSVPARADAGLTRHSSAIPPREGPGRRHT